MLFSKAKEQKLADRSQFYNRLMLLGVLVLLFFGPMLIALPTSIILVYGVDYIPTLIANPGVIPGYFMHLLGYWLQYNSQLDMLYTLKIMGPPGFAALFTLSLAFAFRAPLMDFRPFKEKESVHGDAHWASPAEIKAAGLRAKNGVLLGSYKKGKYYIADGFQHILLFAPTGSGKGVGFAIPNLLFWDQSCCVHDIKLENYELCSGWRAGQGQDVFVWNPANPDGITHCYNPLDWISEKPGQMVDDVQKISSLILPEQEFWQNEARSLLVGVILYLCAVPEKLTSFGEVVRTMRSDDVTYNLAVVLDTIGKKIHPVAYMNIAAFLQKADKERSGVVSTMNSGLELWANPLIDTATASSDFNVAHWKKKKITVYCGVTPDNLQRLQPLLQVFYQQCTDILTRHMPKPDEPYGVLFLLDEFPTLGKMPQFEAGIAYFRGYRCRLFLIVQDTQQLKGIYEEAGMNSFLSNATYRITFAANNVETANLISQLIGNKTMRQESHNQPRFFDVNPAARTKHVSEVQRALLLPQEVIQLPRDEQIILIESEPPIKCKKIFYFKDPFFTKRLLPQTPVPEQEPYDPRKKDEEAAKPESKEDHKSGSSDAKPTSGEKKPDATATLPAPDKPAAKPAAKPGGDAKPAAANPFGTPPAPAGDAKAAAKPASPKANPFDLPPAPAKKDDKAAAKPGDDTKPAAANPFGAPPAPPKKDGEKTAAAKPASDDKKPFNPFDLPPVPPKKPDIEQPKSGVDMPGTKGVKHPPTPEKFGPPIPAPKGTEKTAAPASDDAATSQATADASSAPEVKASPGKPTQDTAAIASAEKANPFNLPPLPAKKPVQKPEDTATVTTKPVEEKPDATAETPKAVASANPFGEPLPTPKKEAPAPAPTTDAMPDTQARDTKPEAEEDSTHTDNGNNDDANGSAAPPPKPATIASANPFGEPLPVAKKSPSTPEGTSDESA